MPSDSVRSETAQQLQVLVGQLEQDNPALYRHWALYLQVLREALLASVQKACFHVSVQTYPERYAKLIPAKRTELHRRMSSLVGRCSSLLTVEQLAVLATQMHGQELQSQRRHQQRWLNSLQEQPEPEPVAASMPNASMPNGSIHLGLELPIGSGLFGFGSLMRGAVDDPDDAESLDSADEPDEVHDPAGRSAVEGDEAHRLMAAFSQVLEQMGEALEADSSGSMDSSWPGMAAEEASADATGLPFSGLLPKHPVGVLRWLEGLDAALVRRLRNLSHALNVEMLRLGATPSLLPLNLLDAVGQGQIETQNAPPNLVRMPLPVGERARGPFHDAVAVLLRPVDLELEQPRLRTCRTRLQQSRQQVRRMAQTYRRLERRLQALDAEQLWLHDHTTAHPPTP